MSEQPAELLTAEERRLIRCEYRYGLTPTGRRIIRLLDEHEEMQNRLRPDKDSVQLLREAVVLLREASPYLPSSRTNVNAQQVDAFLRKPEVLDILRSGHVRLVRP